MTFAEKILPDIKLRLRESSNDFDTEIKNYINAACQNLQLAGINNSYFDVAKDVDIEILIAVGTYVLAKYGLYNDDSEKYETSYKSQKATMCCQQRYLNKRA